LHLPCRSAMALRGRGGAGGTTGALVDGSVVYSGGLMLGGKAMTVQVVWAANPATRLTVKASGEWEWGCTRGHTVAHGGRACSGARLCFRVHGVRVCVCACVCVCVRERVHVVVVVVRGSGRGEL
jgi:hypothetical protein